MKLGIFAKTFSRNSVDEVLDAIREHGLDSTQFNMSCAGMPPMPDRIDSELAHSIGSQCRQRNIQIAAVSGTFNMAHPEEPIRRIGLKRLRVLAEVCSSLGTSIVTLCTGSRDRDDMWRQHPDNRSAEAWRDMMNSIETAVTIAEEYNILLGIEPESSNVVYDAGMARKLLNEIRSPHLKIVIDAANLYNPERDLPMNDVLSEAFDLLGEHIVLAHAKDLMIDGEAEFVAAGQGIVDYEHYVQLLSAAKFEGPLILHGLEEAQVESSLRYLRALLPS